MYGCTELYGPTTLSPGQLGSNHQRVRIEGHLEENILESEMGSLDMDLECRRSIEESKTLAGIFQSIVQDCKVFQASFSTSFIY